MDRNQLSNRNARENIVRDEEELVPDARARLRPAEMVEQKLVSLLKGLPVHVSQLYEAERKCPRP
jgi:hypothetical protein